MLHFTANVTYMMTFFMDYVMFFDSFINFNREDTINSIVRLSMTLSAPVLEYEKVYPNYYAGR